MARLSSGATLTEYLLIAVVAVVPVGLATGWAIRLRSHLGVRQRELDGARYHLDQLRQDNAALVEKLAEAKRWGEEAVRAAMTNAEAVRAENEGLRARATDAEALRRQVEALRSQLAEAVRRADARTAERPETPLREPAPESAPKGPDPTRMRVPLKPRFGGWSGASASKDTAGGPKDTNGAPKDTAPSPEDLARSPVTRESLRLQVFRADYFAVRAPGLTIRPLAPGLVQAVVSDVAGGKVERLVGSDLLPRLEPDSDAAFALARRQCAPMRQEILSATVPEGVELLVCNAFYLSGCLLHELAEGRMPRGAFVMPVSWHHWCIHPIGNDTRPEVVVPLIDTVGRKVAQEMTVSDAARLGTTVYWVPPNGGAWEVLELRSDGTFEPSPTLAAALARPSVVESKRETARGHELGNERRFAEAEAVLRRAVALDPDSAEAHVELGWTLSQQGRDAEAIALYSGAIARGGNMNLLRNNRGNCRQRTGDFKGAVEDYTWCVSAKADWHAARASLASALNALGERERAREEVAELRRQGAPQEMIQTVENVLGIQSG